MSGGTLQLAWRNIWRNRRRTLLSMSAIGIGLMLVIFYSGMVGGMLGEAKHQLDSGGLGHIEIVAPGYRPRHEVNAHLPAFDTWRSKLSLPPGTEVGARINSRGLAQSPRGNEPIALSGVEWADERLLSAHLRTLSQGELPTQADAHGVLVGEQLAERLNLKIGSKLRLMVQRADGEMGADLFRVRGIFHSVAPSIGQRAVYVSTAAASALVGLSDITHQVVIQLSEPDQADALAAQLKTVLGDGFEVQTWSELLPVLKRMETLTDNVVLVLAIFVYLLVGLGVLNTMLMSVLERTREFGVLMSLGTRPNRIITMVLSESFWVATLSVAIGAAAGTALSWYFSRTGIRVNAATESYQFEGATISTLVKTRFAVADVLKAAGLVYAMALVVGLYPASRITRLLPAEALRRT